MKYILLKAKEFYTFTHRRVLHDLYSLLLYIVKIKYKNYVLMKKHGATQNLVALTTDIHFE